MQRLVSYADELVTSIGPRPGGSNGEHEAAELIATNLEGFGLDTWLQDFSSTGNTSWIRILSYMLGVVAAELLFALDIKPLVLVLAILALLLLVLDMIGFEPLLKALSRRSSQNVIACHIPERADPHRKVVVVAHYDSGRTLTEGAPAIVQFYPLLRKVIQGSVVLLALVALLSLFPLPELILMLLSVVGLIIGIILLVSAVVEIFNRFRPYSHGANCNASGIAVLMGVADALAGSMGSQAPTGARRSFEADSSEQFAGAPAGAPAGAQAGAQTTPARNGVLARASGATGELFARAKGLVGRKAAEPGETDTLGPGPEFVPENYAEVAGRSAIRSGVPTNRGEKGPRRAGGPGAARDAYGNGRGLGEFDSGAAEQGSASVSGAAAATQSGFYGGPEAGPSGSGAENRPLAHSRIEIGATDNPAIRVRETLAERQQQQRAALSAEEASSRTKDGLPAWFVDAKKAAGKETTKGAVEADEMQVTRSRFADVPIEVAIEPKPEPRRAQGSPQAALPDNAAGVAGSPEAAAMANAAQPASGTEPAAAQAAVMPESDQKSVAMTEHPTTLNADFTGIDRLATDPTAMPPLRVRLPKSATTLEQAVATPAPAIPAHDNLRNLPTLSLGNSGSIPTQQAAFDQQSLYDLDEQADGRKRVSNTGSFAPLGATGIMKPVGEELLEYSNDQDIYIDDADESAAWSGAANARERSPQIMDIPKSRTKSFFSSLGDRLSGSRKSETHDSSPADWLGVDENYDARLEGSQIGGWENFSEADDDDWKGGAYGGASDEENYRALQTFSSTLIDKEVWLVALGSHESGNAGMKKLLQEYERELKNALIINIDGVGAGELYFTMAEGSFIPKGTDHRLQGLVQSAGDALGIDLAPCGFTVYDSDAAAALALGARAISIVGLADKAPVGWRWKTDRLDIIKEDNLQEVTELLIEIIKSS